MRTKIVAMLSLGRRLHKCAQHYATLAPPQARPRPPLLPPPQRAGNATEKRIQTRAPKKLRFAPKKARSASSFGTRAACFAARALIPRQRQLQRAPPPPPQLPRSEGRWCATARMQTSFGLWLEQAATAKARLALLTLYFQRAAAMLRRSGGSVCAVRFGALNWSCPGHHGKQTNVHFASKRPRTLALSSTKQPGSTALMLRAMHASKHAGRMQSALACTFSQPKKACCTNVTNFRMLAAKKRRN